MEGENHIIDIPDSGGLKIVERTIKKTATNKPGDIEREIIDFEEMLLAKIAAEGILDLERHDEEVKQQKSFDTNMRILFKVLRSFPENRFALRQLEKIISQESIPWRILSYAEHIPRQFYPLIVAKFEEYIRENREELYTQLEMTESIGKQLSHLACFGHLQPLLSDLVSVLPSDIAFQILQRGFYEDSLEDMLITKAEGYSNRMTETQIEHYQERKKLKQRRNLHHLQTPTTIEIPQGGVVLQLFPHNDDGFRSFRHFLKMMQNHDFSHEEVGGLHIFTNKRLRLIVNDPSCGSDENILYFLEENEEDIDICIIRGHTGSIDVLSVLDTCNAPTFIIGGCESSKYLRKDIQQMADRRKKEGVIQGRTYVASRSIGKMSINDGIIEAIILSANLGKNLDTETVNQISGGTYDTFYIDR